MLKYLKPISYKKINWGIVLWVCLFALNQNAFGQFWERTNPGGGGWMMAVGAGPTGDIFVGSDLSGAYRSVDEGESWDVIGAASGLIATHVSAVGFDPIDPDIVYFGTNTGIFRSADGGDTVIHVFDPDGPASAIGDIEIALDDPNIGYATYQPVWNGLEGVVYKTTDHGLSWAPVSIDLPDNLRLVKLLIDPTNSDIVYVLSGFDRFACGPKELYKSINGGVNWTELATEISDLIELMDVAIDPINPENLYLTTMNFACGAPLAYEGDLFKSTDGGATWYDPNPSVERSGVIWINHENPSIVRLIDVRKTAPWIPTSGTFTSTDSGVTWEQNGFETDWGTGYLEEFSEDLGTVIHKSYGTNRNYTQTLGMDLSDPDKLYWINTRFVYGTNDGGTIFKNLFTHQIDGAGWQSSGVDNVVVLDLEISAVNPDIVYAGFADNGLWRSLDAGASWESCNDFEYTGTWQGFGGNTYCVTADPSRENVVWAAARDNDICHLLRSDSTGERGTWSPTNEGLPVTTRVTDIAVDPNSPVLERTIFAVISKDIYKSADDGYNWTLSDSNGGVWFVVVDPNDSDRIYAGGNGGFFLSADGGDSWTQTGLDEMSDIDNTYDSWRKYYRGISSIRPSSCEPGLVYATVYGTGKGLYRSMDYGSTWEKILTGDHMRSVVVSENNQEAIFVGSSYVGYAGGTASPGLICFQFSLDGGETWTIDDAELEFPSIASMELNHSNPEKLFIASQGSGIQWAYDWIVPYTYYADLDGDLFGDPENSIDTCTSLPPAGYTTDSLDCDDSNADINPLADEITNNDIDENCDGEILTTTSIKAELGNQIAVFPNPVNDLLTIQFESNQQAEIELINAFGSTLLKTQVNPTNAKTELELSQFAAGIYFVRVTDENGAVLAITKIQKL